MDVDIILMDVDIISKYFKYSSLHIFKTKTANALNVTEPIVLAVHIHYCTVGSGSSSYFVQICCDFFCLQQAFETAAILFG